MWTGVTKCAFALLCACITLDLASARDRPPRGVRPGAEDATNTGSDISNMGTMTRHAEDSVRFPRKYPQEGDSRLRRLNIIDRKTGFDGRVRRIHFGSEENAPGIRAYGIPEPDIIEPIPHIGARFGEPRFDGDPRSGRMPEDALRMNVDNGQIEMVSSQNSAPPKVSGRIARSTRDETENELEDLEAQDAKVFRPLFVYRQQVAQREKRRQNRRGYSNPRTQHEVTHGKSCGSYHGHW